MSEPTVTVPPGFMEDARGAFVPISKIKPVDLARDKVVNALIDLAKEERSRLVALKVTAFDMFTEFLELSLAEYGVKPRGEKGNVQLATFDGRKQVHRQIAERMVFDERLQAAKILVDQCLTDFSKGSKAEMKLLIGDAFQVDGGRVRVDAILRLLRNKIDDPRWHEAKAAVFDSMSVESTKSYMRFYERQGEGPMQAISLNFAAI